MRLPQGKVLPIAPLTNHGISNMITSSIDVFAFTLLAPVWPIQGHALHPYIMVDTAVPWLDTIPLIGHQILQKQLTK
jgi:hypothetical protein